MALSEIFSLNPVQAYYVLEDARWNGEPKCPYCACDTKIWEHPEKRRRAPRFQCGACARAFCATVNTIFHRSHVPIRTWFLAIAHTAEDPAINASRLSALISISRHATVSRMLSRIKSALLRKDQNAMLIEAILFRFGMNLDEFYETYDAI